MSGGGSRSVRPWMPKDRLMVCGFRPASRAISRTLSMRPLTMIEMPSSASFMSIINCFTFSRSLKVL